MKIPLRCLLIEDSESDAVILIEALQQGGYMPECERVQTEQDMRTALAGREWDVIFSDYILPTFDGPSALRVFQETQIEIPFIIVSGEIGEDTAVESLKLGADDYLLKQNLRRLIPAVHRALKDREERRRARQAERALQQSEERFRLMVEQVLDYAIFMLDPEGRVTTWNAGAKHIHGFAAGEILGRSWACFFAADEEAGNKPARLLEQARDTGGVMDEGWCMHKDSTRFWAQMTLSAAKDEQGQLRSFTVITHDLTERRQAEDQRHHIELQLRQAQKLEAIGQLAAGIAHEINTPIQFVEHNLRFLHDSFSDLKMLLDHHQVLLLATENGNVAPELVQQIRKLLDQVEGSHLVGEIPGAIDEAMQGTERIAKIVRAMKEFSHPGSGKEKPTPTNLNQAVESTITVARNEWKYVAEMVTELDPGLPPVPLFAGEFNQVILNLLVNAAHAIAEILGKNSRTKGTIKVSTRRDNAWVEVRISDSGAGIPEAIRHRIFEPFFTTKAVGQGTGQGLALARSVIVERHRGELRFETEPGKGTCFIIRLPLNPPTPVKAAAQPK
jgi:PAS domain S-box-containing protein